VGTYQDEEMFERLKIALDTIQVRVVKPKIGATRCVAVE
jgi:hypothetical protein